MCVNEPCGAIKIGKFIHDVGRGTQRSLGDVPQLALNGCVIIFTLNASLQVYYFPFAEAGAHQNELFFMPHQPQNDKWIESFVFCL